MSLVIRIYKRRRLLEAARDGQCVLRCAVRLGFGAQDGHKQREGDGRTPEGEYFVCTRNARSKFYLSLGISYPNAKDAREALSRGQIDPETAARIERAQAERRRPDWDTPLGGFIMIHGQDPAGREGDWTCGCVALENGDMARLFAMAQLGDRVILLA